jgi:hypothetical protein
VELEVVMIAQLELLATAQAAAYLLLVAVLVVRVVALKVLDLVPAQDVVVETN